MTERETERERERKRERERERKRGRERERESEREREREEHQHPGGERAAKQRANAPSRAHMRDMQEPLCRHEKAAQHVVPVAAALLRQAADLVFRVWG